MFLVSGTLTVGSGMSNSIGFFLPGSGDRLGVENEEITGSTFAEAGVY